jgi:hypothetical protein
MKEIDSRSAIDRLAGNRRNVIAAEIKLTEIEDYKL